MWLKSSSITSFSQESASVIFYLEFVSGNPCHHFLRIKFFLRKAEGRKIWTAKKVITSTIWRNQKKASNFILEMRSRFIHGRDGDLEDVGKAESTRSWAPTEGQNVPGVSTTTSLLRTMRLRTTTISRWPSATSRSTTWSGPTWGT